MKKRIVAGLCGLAVFGLVAALLPSEAQAHGRREINGGKYQLLFGFLEEPAYTGVKNGIDLRICAGVCETLENGQLKNPVKDAEKTLKAQVIQGSETTEIELRPRFRADGSYNGYFFPGRAGEYTFRFYGTLNGDPVDERVTSGKDGFDSVQEPKIFPVAGSVSNAETTLARQVKEANDKAGSATLFGIIGTSLGLMGLAAGAFALRRSTRLTTHAGLPRPEREPQGG